MTAAPPRPGRTSGLRGSALRLQLSTQARFGIRNDLHRRRPRFVAIQRNADRTRPGRLIPQHERRLANAASIDKHPRAGGTRVDDQGASKLRPAIGGCPCGRCCLWRGDLNNWSIGERRRDGSDRRPRRARNLARRLLRWYGRNSGLARRAH